MRQKTVVIVDYNLGNLHSIHGAVKKVGHIPKISNNPSVIGKADCLILPGVGAFKNGMDYLSEVGLVDVLAENVFERKTPILAICLGMQLLARESSEFGKHAGLGWINASVEKINSEDKTLRIPHVGWNECHFQKESPLFKGIKNRELFYYTHSYYFSTDDDIVIGKCDYGKEFTVAIQKDNIFATQFHPEKSQLAGLTLIKNFIEID